MRNGWLQAIAAAAAVVFGTAVAFGQTATTRPATDEVAMTAVAVKAVGSIQAADVPAEGQAAAWRPVRVGDRLGAGTMIRTGLRSSLLLQFGDNTIVKIDRVTSATIAQFHRTATTQRVKLDMGYGAIRAGVSEGTVQSDMTIETPAATLTRRGTWNFGIEYEAVTGRFVIYLEGDGLVEALNKLTEEQRLLERGQYVTEAMIRWIETADFDRYIPIPDWAGMTDTDWEFNVRNESGRTVLNVGGGSNAWSQARLEPVNPVTRTGVPVFPLIPILVPPGRGVVDRPEGNFGTGAAR